MISNLEEMIQTYKSLPEEYHDEMEALSTLVVEHDEDLPEIDILRTLAYYITKSYLLEKGIIPIKKWQN